MPRRLRRAFDGDDPEAERHLPGRPARAASSRTARGSRSITSAKPTTIDDHAHGPGHGEPDDDGEREEERPLDEDVDQLRHAARRQAGELEVEHHGLGRDDAGGVEGHCLGTVPAGTATAVAGPTVDIDRFITTNQASWTRLEQLTAMAGSARLGPAEVDEFVQLYQRASTHLSHAAHRSAPTRRSSRASRGWSPTPAACSTAPAPGRWRGSPGSSPPASRPRCGTPAGSWWPAPLLLFVPAILMGSWLARSDAALEASAPDALREAYVEEDFEAYYSSAPASQFATEVTVNNIQVGFLAFAVGILLCVPTAFILASNGANLGSAAGLFAAVGQQPKFYGLILPHGLLELSAIVVAGAAGLAVGWAIIDPGDRTAHRGARRAGPPLRRDRARPCRSPSSWPARSRASSPRAASPRRCASPSASPPASPSGPTSSSSAAAPPPRATPAPSASTSASSENEPAPAADARAPLEPPRASLARTSWSMASGQGRGKGRHAAVASWPPRASAPRFAIAPTTCALQRQFGPSRHGVEAGRPGAGVEAPSTRSASSRRLTLTRATARLGP